MTILAVLAVGAALTGPVPEAIEQSVKDRMGDVRVAVVEISGARVREDETATVRPGGTVRAVPESGSRLGRTIRFILFAGDQRVGSVVATLAVEGPVVRATRAIARGETVAAGNIEVADAELKNVFLKRLPTLEEIAGAAARRDIAAGEVLTDALVLAPPTVRSGDEVRVSLTSGPVQVTGTGRASGSGRVGDVIRVLVPASRRGLKARITGPGSVEIVR